MRPTQVFLQFKEEMVVTWGYVWAVGRVCDSIPTKFVDEIGTSFPLFFWVYAILGLALTSLRLYIA
jgi:hypothetical protein